MSDSFETTGYDLLGEWCPVCGLDLEAGQCPGCEGERPQRAHYTYVKPPRRYSNSQVVGGLLAITAYVIGISTSMVGAVLLTLLAFVGTVSYAFTLWSRGRSTPRAD